MENELTEFLKDADYQMKRSELVKEAIFFGTYTVEESPSLLLKDSEIDNNEKEM